MGTPAATTKTNGVKGTMQQRPEAELMTETRNEA
jgi:hypothetical protein